MTTAVWPWPKGTVASQWFGQNPGGYNPAGGHTGIDAAIAAGTPLLAADDGVIEHEGWFGTQDGSDNPWWLTDGGGIQIVLNTGDGKPNINYAHLSASLVDRGQRVTKGQLIGYSGNTGRWTTGPHCHLEALPPGYNLNTNTYGRVDPSIYLKMYWEDVVALAQQAIPAGPTLAGWQRTTVPDARVGFRVGPAASAELIKWLEPDHVYDFKGYVRRDGDHWFVGRYTDGFAWRGGFTDEGTHDLEDLTDILFPPPAPAANNIRVTGPDGVNRRKMADKGGPLIDTFGPGLDLTLGGYVIGTEPYPGAGQVWFVGGISGGYMHSSGFTSQSTEGLPLLELPASVPPSSLPAYDFELDFTEVNGHQVRKSPAHRGNLEQGNFPAEPVGIVIHQMGTPGVDTLGSTRNTFTKEGELKSSNFGVGKDGELDQFVKLGHRGYHAGPGGNDMYSIETDPEQSEYTIATGRALVKLLRDRHPGRTLKLYRHNGIAGSATSCGTLIDLAKYEPLPEPVVVPPAPQPTTVDEAGVLRKFFEWLLQGFLNRDKK